MRNGKKVKTRRNKEREKMLKLFWDYRLNEEQEKNASLHLTCCVMLRSVVLLTSLWSFLKNCWRRNSELTNVVGCRFAELGKLKVEFAPFETEDFRCQRWRIEIVCYCSCRNWTKLKYNLIKIANILATLPFLDFKSVSY